MFRSIRKIISAKPWLIVGLAYLAFVVFSIQFVIVAVKHQPRQVERVVVRQTHGGGPP